jgi:xylulokinase
VFRPHSGWSEQDPADWIAATERALDKLSTQHLLTNVKGIGLSGQMHGATALDKNDSVLRHAILWNDTRASAQAAEMDEIPQFRKISGNIIFPGFTAPKLAWMKIHEPALFDQVAMVLLPKDYLRLWLTGERVSEMSDAAGTSWLDTGARDWSDDLLYRSGLSRSEMPELVEGNAVSGTLRRDLAHRWGIPASTVVAGGAGDNAATAIGMGIVRPGNAFLSLGTSGVLFAANDGYYPDPATAVHTFCHAVPNTWHQMAVILAAADALSWFAQLVGQTPAALTDNLGNLQPPSKTLFLPYLGGERTPLNDSDIRGAFVGLEHSTGVNAAVQAVLEGVGFAMRDCLDALTKTGTPIETLIAVGGGSQSDYWLKAIATILNLEISVPVNGEFGAAFGAARLGMMAAEKSGAEIALMPDIQRVIEPDTSLKSAFDDGFHRFKSTQTAVRGLS